MSKKKFSLSGLFGFLESKGVKVKLNEEATDEDQQFELVEETEDTDADLDPIATNQFSEDEVKGIKSLLSTFAELEPAAFANALKGMPTALTFIKNAEDTQKAEKTLVINRIKANSASLFTDEELEALPISILNKMDAQTDVNYMALGGGQEVFSNSGEDEVLTPKPSLFAMAEQESE